MASASAFRSLPLVGPTAERPLQQAFVLRLSEDSLDALRELMINEQGEGMELELGLGETLLHIPNHSSFTLTPAELTPSTEFVSHPSPSSPYFLHSSASTRYTIRQTTVSAATKNKLRLGTEQAAKDKAERRIVQLDHEPVKVKGGKGKAAAASSSSLNKDGLPAHMRSKPLSSGSVGSVGSRGSSPAGRMGGGALTPGGSPAMASSAVRAGSRDGSNPLRTRIVQLLAMGPMSSRDLVAKVKSREEDVIEVLNSVAKPPSASRLYQLLPKSFLELDIFGWKAYSRADREKVVAATLHAFDVDLRLPKDAPERRILDPDFVKSPAKPVYPTSALGQSHSGSFGLGLGVGLGGGSGRSASPLPPASPADDSGSASSSSTLQLKGTGAVAAGGGKKKGVTVSTTSSSVASKRKGRDDDDDEEGGEIKEPKPSKPSSALNNNGNGSSSSSSQDHSKRRKTIDPHSFSNDSLLPATTPSSSSSSLKKSTSSTSLNKSILPSHTKSHLSISSSTTSVHVPTPYSSRPSTPLIPDHPPPPSTHTHAHHSRRKASPTFTSSSGSSSSPSSSRSSSPSSSSSPPPPLNLPDSPGALRKRFKALWPEYDLLNESLGRERERSEGILAGKIEGGGAGAGGGGGGKSLKEVKGEVRRRKVIHRELEEIKGRLGRRAAEREGKRGGGKGK